MKKKRRFVRETSSRYRTYEQPTDPNALSLGQLELGYRTKSRGGGSKSTQLGGYGGSIMVYRAAVGYNDDSIYMLDVVCSPTEYRAIHAAMTSGISAKFRFYGCGIPSHRTLEREKLYGYKTYVHKIMIDGVRTNSKFHYLAVSQHPSFIPYVDHTAVAYKLATPTFSTPFLSPDLHGDVPDWMPYIVDEMLDKGMLSYLPAHNCLPGFLHTRENVLQEIVTRGVKTGKLAWPKYDPEEIRTAVAEAAGVQVAPTMIEEVAEILDEESTGEPLLEVEEIEL
jgi:hypothetical protein